MYGAALSSTPSSTWSFSPPVLFSSWMTTTKSLQYCGRTTSSLCDGQVIPLSQIPLSLGVLRIVLRLLLTEAYDTVLFMSTHDDPVVFRSTPCAYSECNACYCCARRALSRSADGYRTRTHLSDDVFSIASSASKHFRSTWKYILSAASVLLSTKHRLHFHGSTRFLVLHCPLRQCMLFLCCSWSSQHSLAGILHGNMWRYMLSYGLPFCISACRSHRVLFSHYQYSSADALFMEVDVNCPTCLTSLALCGT